MLISSVRSAPAPPVRSTTTAAPAADTFVPSSQEEVPTNIAKALAAAGKPYFDETKDQADQAKYYADMPADLTPADRYDSLKKLVSRTHTTRFGFDPIKRLFPWVDLRPNLRLQSIYSPTPTAIDAPIKSTKQRDFIQRIKTPMAPRVRADGTLGPARFSRKKQDLREQAKNWTKMLMESPTDALGIAQKIALVEGYKYYNAEHSVPQFFFDKHKDPKGDLHHLFTCERMANSLRGCRPYADLEHTSENRGNGQDGWAPKNINAFEPDAGKGAVARAALYFLARYPGEVGDQAGEYRPEDIATFQRWSREEPVSLYEKHRNQAIFEVQGNRNPFIDHPEWADQVDFTAAFFDASLAAGTSGPSPKP